MRVDSLVPLHEPDLPTRVHMLDGTIIRLPHIYMQTEMQVCLSQDCTGKGRSGMHRLNCNAADSAQVRLRRVRPAACVREELPRTACMPTADQASGGCERHASDERAL